MRINTPFGAVNTNYQFMPMYYNYGSGDPFKNALYIIQLKNTETIVCKGSMMTKDGLTTIKLKKPLKDSIIYPSNTISIRHVIKTDTSTAYPYKDSIWIIEPSETMKSKAIVMYLPMSIKLNAIYLKQNDVLTLATKENVLKLVEGNAKAERKANRGELGDAMDYFNKKKVRRANRIM